MKIQTLSYKELIELERSIARAKIIVRAKEEKEFRERCLKIIDEAGFTLAQIFGNPRKRKASKLN